jgi:hypothetical protein
MATAGALVGLVVPGVLIDDVACTAKTIPDFPGRWTALVEAKGEGASQRPASEERTAPGSRPSDTELS